MDVYQIYFKLSNLLSILSPIHPDDSVSHSTPIIPELACLYDKQNISEGESSFKRITAHQLRMKCKPGVLQKEIYIHYNPSLWLDWDKIDVYLRSTCDDPFLGDKMAEIEKRSNLKVEIVLNNIMVMVDMDTQQATYPAYFPLPMLADSDRFYDREFCQWIFKRERLGLTNKDLCPIISSVSSTVSSDDNSLELHGFGTDLLMDWCKKSNRVTSLHHRSAVAEFSIKGSRFYHIKLVLKTSNNYVTRHEIRPAKTLIEFCAEIGGHLGLFVGVSILTLVELLDFFCKVAHNFCRVTFDRKIVHVI